MKLIELGIILVVVAILFFVIVSYAFGFGMSSECSGIANQMRNIGTINSIITLVLGMGIAFIISNYIKKKE